MGIRALLIARRRLLVAALTQERALDSLVVVGRVSGFEALGASVFVTFDPVGAAGAAARAEQPEESGGAGEQHGDPCDHVNVVAQGAMDVVFLESRVEHAGEGGVQDGGGEGEGNDENAADGARDRRGQTAPSTEEREETDDDFHRGRDDGDHVRYHHPFGDGFVGF